MRKHRLSKDRGGKRECKYLPIEQKEAYQEQAVFLLHRLVNQTADTEVSRVPSKSVHFFLPLSEFLMHLVLILGLDDTYLKIICSASTWNWKIFYWYP